MKLMRSIFLLSSVALILISCGNEEAKSLQPIEEVESLEYDSSFYEIEKIVVDSVEQILSERRIYFVNEYRVFRMIIDSDSIFISPPAGAMIWPINDSLQASMEAHEIRSNRPWKFLDNEIRLTYLRNTNSPAPRWLEDTSGRSYVVLTRRCIPIQVAQRLFSLSDSAGVNLEARAFALSEQAHFQPESWK